jgi:phosphoribosylformimino-5-aminoimidazole carboxamide ribotide isomerase
MIQIIPAIDLMGGKCVRLSQGRFEDKKVYDSDPVEMAKAYADAGCTRIHIVDLDGAKAGSPQQTDLIVRIAQQANVEIQSGGGMQSVSLVESALKSGISAVVIGTAAIRQPEMLRECLIKFGGDRIILAADVLNEIVMISGWAEDSNIEIRELIERFVPYGLNQVLVTDINRDGMLGGTATGLYVSLQQQWPHLEIIASGGVGSISDIICLDNAGIRSVIVGKAIYEGRILMNEIREINKKNAG